jgi:hypothetical protein
MDQSEFSDGISFNIGKEVVIVDVEPLFKPRIEHRFLV